MILDEKQIVDNLNITKNEIYGKKSVLLNVFV